MAYQGVPTIRRRLLGTNARMRRESLGMTPDSVAKALGVARTTVVRWESGHTAVSETDLARLIALYGITDQQETARWEMFRAKGRIRGTWSEFGPNVAPTLRDLIDAEGIATKIRVWEPLVIPWLFQTDAYTEATLLGASLWTAREDEQARRELMETRTNRKGILNREDGPAIWAVIGEGALRTMTGGAVVMREQLEMLLKIEEMPRVSLQVLPFSAGANPGAVGSFELLAFENDLTEQAVYFEVANTVTDDPKMVSDSRDRMDHLLSQAKSPQSSRDHIRELIATL